MKCPNCGNTNRSGVKFCEECGQKMPKTVKGGIRANPRADQSIVTCGNCGHANRAGSRFCEECGITLAIKSHSDSQSRRKGFFYGFGLSAGGILLLCLLCGLLYWSMLIPVPLLPKSSPMADVFRRVRIIQENLGRQQGKRENVDQTTEQGTQQTVEFKNGKIVMPDACGPQVDLQVGAVSQVQIWDELGQFGSGPLIYSIPNRGESMADGEFGYHAEWVVIDEGERKVIKDNQWYACTGWDQDELTCTGPDWREFDSAQMCIYYEDPACQVPVQCYIFNGDDAFPAQNRQACAQEDVHFQIDSIETDNEEPVWYIWTDDARAYDHKYVLKTTTEDGITLEYLLYREPNLIGIAPDPDEHPNLRWEILRVPQDVCTEVLASGTMGEVAFEENVDLHTKDSCEEPGTFAFTIEKIEPNGKTGADWYIRTNDPDVYDGKYSLKTSNQSPFGGGMEAPCNVSNDPSLLICENYTLEELSDFPPFKWEIFQEPIEKCTEALAEGSIGEEVVVSNQGSRCDVFDGLAMSIIFFEWQPGSPLTFYAKMPGGVPGLERNITGDEDAWHYKAKIGGYTTDGCNYEGYKERLYCRISLPSEYSSSIQPMDININGCEAPIFTDQRAELPGILGRPSSGGSSDGSSGSDGSSSGSGPYSCAGGASCPSGYYCDTMYYLCVPQ